MSRTHAHVKHSQAYTHHNSLRGVVINWIYEHQEDADFEEELRIERLIKRHIGAGKTPADAELWSRGSDQKNAEAIIALRDRADLVITLVE